MARYDEKEPDEQAQQLKNFIDDEGSLSTQTAAKTRASKSDAISIFTAPAIPVRNRITGRKCITGEAILPVAGNAIRRARRNLIFTFFTDHQLDVDVPDSLHQITLWTSVVHLRVV